MTYAIADKNRDGVYLKFITPNWPTGLWSGESSARSFDTEPEALEYLERLKLAVCKEALEKAERVLCAPWVSSYKVPKFFQVFNDLSVEITGYCVVPHPRSKQ